MFKNILVPHDGSAVSRKAVREALNLAKSIGAKVTGLHVAPPYQLNIQEDYIPRDFMMPADYAARAKRVAGHHLDGIRKAAGSRSVVCDTHYVLSEYPADAILKAASRYRCDAIAMGSHGRTGIQKLFLGSETQKVLAGSKVPVLVIR